MNLTATFAFIKADKKIIKLHFNDIAFIQGLGNYVQIVMIDGRKHIHYRTLKDLIDKLPQEFMRVHNSCIVNLTNIESVDDNHIVVQGTRVAISKSYQKCFADSLTKLML